MHWSGANILWYVIHNCVEEACFFIWIEINKREKLESHNESVFVSQNGFFSITFCKSRKNTAWQMLDVTRFGKTNYKKCNFWHWAVFVQNPNKKSFLNEKKIHDWIINMRFLLFRSLKKPFVAVLIDCYLKAFKLRTTWINNNEFINAAP